ncbi:MAG: xylan 1,4-beta-xylosidase [Oscillospiraceae bacterium]|nr:xylan 1,4-beta-xylosidase [Oscillospiraceae bacterium]
MAKQRFVEVYDQGVVNVAKIIVDTETGVNYLLSSHNKANGTGLTVLVDQNGKPIVTPIDRKEL